VRFLAEAGLAGAKPCDEIDPGQEQITPTNVQGREMLNFIEERTSGAKLDRTFARNKLVRWSILALSAGGPMQMTYGDARTQVRSALRHI
jgi:hypothetical protein